LLSSEFNLYCRYSSGRKAFHSLAASDVSATPMRALTDLLLQHPSAHTLLDARDAHGATVGLYTLIPSLTAPAPPKLEFANQNNPELASGTRTTKTGLASPKEKCHLELNFAYKWGN
jgi:hypothetical protein